MVMSFAMSVDLIALGILYFQIDGPDSSSQLQTFAVILLFVYVILFEFSLGPIPWLYMAETMTEKGLSIAVMVNMLMALLISIVFPYLVDWLGWLFIFFGVICAIVIYLLCLTIRLQSGVFSLFILRETKGLSERDVALLYSPREIREKILRQESNNSKAEPETETLVE